MSKQPKTKVLFRMWKGGPEDVGEELIALFPEDEEGPGKVESYQHVGGHGTADLYGIMHRSRPAKPAEYASLKRELESSPYEYNLQVAKRTSRKRRTRHGASR